MVKLEEQIKQLEQELNQKEKKGYDLYLSQEIRIDDFFVTLFITHDIPQDKFAIKCRYFNTKSFDLDIRFFCEGKEQYGYGLSLTYRAYQNEFSSTLKKDDLVMTINTPSLHVSRIAPYSFLQLKMLNILCEKCEKIEEFIYSIISNEEFIKITAETEKLKKEIDELKVKVIKQKKTEFINKLKKGVQFIHVHLPNHIYIINKITNKFIYYDDYMVLSENKTQHWTEGRIRIDDFASSCLNYKLFQLKE